MIGNEHDKAIRKILDASPIPNQSSARGKMASGEIGRMSSINGSSISSNNSNLAMNAPMATEMMAEMENPSRMRRKLAQMSEISEPSSSMRHISLNIVVGAGTRSGSNNFILL